MVLEIIKDIAAVVGCISAILSLIAICSKSFRAGIKRFFDKNTREIVQMNLCQDEKIMELSEKLDNFIEESRIARQELKDQLVCVQQGSKNMMRQHIMSIYYDHKATRKIPLHKKEILDELYKDYKSEGGNSYIDKYYDRMNKWEVDYSEDDLD